MEEKDDSEKLIGKMIKKRKVENKAFTKILNAIEPKPNGTDESPSSSKNSKSNKT
jgi:hypothetical protein